MNTRKSLTAPRATWRERFLEVSRQAGEPATTPTRSGLGLRPRGRTGSSAFAVRRRQPVATAAA